MTPFEPARAPHGVTGMLILAPDTDLTLYTPGWNGPTYFLPVGSPQPGMSDTDDDNWYYRLPDLVRCAGTRMHVSFLNTPSDTRTNKLEPTPRPPADSQQRNQATTARRKPRRKTHEWHS